MAFHRRPLISVVTPSFNQGGFIERTLRSVLCQDYPRVEYIVVDGLSSDATHAVLERLGTAVDVLIRERDGGLADALNKGFVRSNGEILAYLNADDSYADPGVLTRVADYFETHPDAEVLFGRRVVVDEGGYFISRWPFVPFDGPTLRRVDFIPQECCFWRRSIWERVGGSFDRKLRFAVDYDLWLRFLACGTRFLAVNDPFGLFRQHRAQKSQARWQEEGWPEVKRLQEQHGVAVTEPELDLAFDRHVFGTGMSRRVRQAWHALGDRRAFRMAQGQPLDRWALGRPLPARVAATLSA
jgi:glycosyltransferase involved in cell wall biosynthesis